LSVHVGCQLLCLFSSKNNPIESHSKVGKKNQQEKDYYYSRYFLANGAAHLLLCRHPTLLHFGQALIIVDLLLCWWVCNCSACGSFSGSSLYLRVQEQ